MHLSSLRDNVSESKHVKLHKRACLYMWCEWNFTKLLAFVSSLMILRYMSHSSNKTSNVIINCGVHFQTFSMAKERKTQGFIFWCHVCNSQIVEEHRSGITLWPLTGDVNNTDYCLHHFVSVIAAEKNGPAWGLGVPVCGGQYLSKELQWRNSGDPVTGSWAAKPHWCRWRSRGWWMWSDQRRATEAHTQATLVLIGRCQSNSPSQFVV